MKVMARLMALILILVTVLSFVPMQAAAADYINVASVASTYGIASGSAAYTALSMINNTYASQLTTAQKQGIVVFMFEGAGNDLSASKRMGAMCVVVKNGSVAYLNRNCSTIPDYPFNPAQNEGTDMPTLKSGIYNFSTVNHLSSYAALNVNSAQVVRHSSKTSYYSSTSSGINVHRRSSDTIPSTSAGWVNSAGCLIIGKTGTSSTGEYAKFIQAIGIVGSGAAGNSKYTTSKTGKIVVDRSLAGSYLSSVGYSSGALSLLGSVDESQPPTKSTISISKTTYAVNEEVIFNMSCNGATNTLWVYRVDGQWQNHYENAGSSYPLAFGWEGEYKALVETWNSKGSKISNEVYFTVGSGTTTTATTTAKPTTTATTTAAVSDKPTSATISVNKSSVEPEENITLTFSGNGKSNTLWVYFPNGTSRYYQNAGTSRTMAFANPGVYYALVETWNAAGTASYQSQKISFTVTPTTAKVTASKSSVTAGDNVTFTMTTNGKINDLWIYYPDGSSKAYQNAGTSKTLSFTTPGTYQALVQTWNTAATFNVISEKITFTVTAKATTVTTTKATTASTTKATTATTTASTTKATTVSTTKATTASTTKATTVTTTKPTTATTQPTTVSTKPTTATTVSTASTTRPTTINPTVSTVSINPCANGHTYKNNYCIYCHQKDPNAVEVSTDPTTGTVMQSQTTTVITTAATDNQDNGGMNVEPISDSGDGYLWVLIALVVVLAIGCAVILVVLMKKKK